MDTLVVWYFTDDKKGDELSNAIKTSGFNIVVGDIKDLNKINLDPDIPNIFIFNFFNMDNKSILHILKNENGIKKYAKFLIIEKDDLDQVLKESFDLMYFEALTRPIEIRDFFIILEKTVVVEKYRHTMKTISKDAEDRIEAYESLVSIRKRDIFETDDEKAAFNKIINFEHRVLDEQNKLNNAIKEFAHQRNKEIFEIKNRLHAEEMLDCLRHKELRDAHDTIKAQESVITFSSKELSEASGIIDASEKVAEFGRQEAIRLHEKIRELEEQLYLLEEKNKKPKSN